MKNYKVGLYLRLSRDDNNSDSENDNDIAGFLNIMNEHYAKDTSRKIKAVKHDQIKKGLFIGSQPPMGYTKDPADKHKLIIDETTMWGSSTIMRMLRNQVYIGHMCQGKRENRSFKMKYRDVVPQDEWVIVENTHEAIINEITWARVQDLLRLNKTNRKPKPIKSNENKEPALFAGKLKCVDCKAVMSYTYSKSYDYKKYYKYRCSTYTNQGKTACSFHSIMDDEIKAIVLNDVCKISELAVANSDDMLSLLLELNSRTKLDNYSILERKAKSIENNLKDTSNKLDVLVNEKVEGNISGAMFKKLMAKYEGKQNEFNDTMLELKAKLTIVKDDTRNIKHLIECFKQKIYIEELDRDTVCELIDCIWVYKKEKVASGYKQRVVIQYNFIGELNGCDITEYFDHITSFQKETDQTA